MKQKMIMFKRVTIRQAWQKTVIPTYSAALIWENHLSSQVQDELQQHGQTRGHKQKEE